jgi:hypothetical protein
MGSDPVLMKCFQPTCRRVDHTGENYTDVMKSIKFLGQLYDSNYDKNYKTQIDNFQEILDKLQLKIITLMRTVSGCVRLP